MRVAVVAVAILLAGCGSADSSPPASTTPAPTHVFTALPEPELGPTAIRILHNERRPSGGVELEVLGPAGTRYGLRPTGGGPAECSQQVVQARPEEPAERVRLVCAGVPGDGPATGTLLVTTDDTSFEEPIRLS